MLDVNDSLILFCGGRYIGLANKHVVAVKDLVIPNENYLKFNNNQLEFNSDKSFTGESFIYDTTGKLIVDLGSKLFIDGKNTIPINKPLNIGLYILTIDTGSEKSSYKFIVE